MSNAKSLITVEIEGIERVDSVRGISMLKLSLKGDKSQVPYTTILYLPWSTDVADAVRVGDRLMLEVAGVPEGPEGRAGAGHGGSTTSESTTTLVPGHDRASCCLCSVVDEVASESPLGETMVERVGRVQSRYDDPARPGRAELIPTEEAGRG